MSGPHALLRLALNALACGLLAGCSQAPTIAMFGAYFPGWLFCIAGGIVLALVVQAALSRRPSLWLPSLPTFLTLATLFSCVFWLLFFKP